MAVQQYPCADEALLALAEKLSTVVLGPPTAALNGVHFTPPVCADMLPPGLDDPQVSVRLWSVGSLAGPAAR
jgi:hypothetical protein